MNGIEAVVKNYQETGDERFFELIMKEFRGRIQARAYRASTEFGLDDTDCESVLATELWNAAKEYKFDTGVPFQAFVALKFNQSLTYFYNLTVTRKGCKTVELFYYMAENEFDLADPRQDVENLLAEQDSAQSLYDDIKSYDKVAADVVALIAAGYTQRETAKNLGYIPTGPSALRAQNNWISRRRNKAQTPTIKHYKKLGIPIPIRLKA